MRPLLLGLASCLLFGCVAVPRAAVSADKAEWVLDADRDTHYAVKIVQGLSRERVIELLGPPRKRGKSKENPAVDIFHYRRTIVGPLVQRWIKTKEGETYVTKSSYLFDYVEIYFADGVVGNVYVKREPVRDGFGVDQLD